MTRFLSLFSGIEAASVAWHPLGWKCVGVAEIDPFPCAVLKHHYQEVPNLGSVTDITDAQIAALGPIDVVVGGSPCQDLSVAGKRAGLAGERSGLFHEQLRIFHAARHLCGARFLLWENVPGAFSSNRGRDFAVVAGAMAGCRLSVPENGWGTEGVVFGEHGLVEWAVLDAQWFGVAQRRRRVFALLDTGGWASRPPILLEPDGMRGDSPPCRETRQVAPTIPSRRTGGGGLGSDFDCDGGLIAAPHDVISPALKARDSKGPSSDGDGDGDGAILVPMVAHSVAPTLRAGGNRTGGDRPPGTDVDTCESLIPVAFMADDYKDGGYEQCDTSRPLTTSADRTRAAPIAVAYDDRNQAFSADTHHTLRAEGVGSRVSDAIFSRPLVVAPPLTASNDPSRSPQSSEVTQQVGAVYQSAMQVRRLTPVECERLQGFPDKYTAIPWRGKPPEQCPDGPRYKALGNSMAVPVMRWIGRRIAEVTA